MNSTSTSASNTMQAVHDCLEGALRTAMVGGYECAYIGSYPTIGRSMVLPAVLVELDSMDAPELSSDGTLYLNCTFSIYCVVAREQEGSSLQVRDMVSRAMLALHHQYVVPGHGRISLLGATEDNVRPEFDAYRVWRIDALVPMHVGNIPAFLGQPAAGDPPMPTQVYISDATQGVGTAPDIIHNGPDLLSDGATTGTTVGPTVFASTQQDGTV